MRNKRNITKFFSILLATVSILFLTGFTHKIQVEDIADDAFMIKHRVIAPDLELGEDEGEYEEFRNIDEVAEEKCITQGKKHLFVHKVFECLQIKCLRFDHVYRCVD